jgi:hypothetical protein
MFSPVCRSLVFERLRPALSCFYGVYQIGDV